MLHKKSKLPLYFPDPVPDTCYMTDNTAATLADIIARYDALIRKNESSEWPTRRLVADCQDGIMGAWGEVVDLAPELSDAGYSALHDMFLAYQAALRVELAEGAGI